MSIERDDEGQIKRLDWANITKILYKLASVYMMAMPMVFNHGTSREDVIQTLLEAFFASANHLGWDPAKSSVVDKEGLEAGLISFLNNILAKRMIDQHRAHCRRVFLALEAEDEHGSRLIDNIRNEARSIESELQLMERQKELIEKAKGDEVMIGMIKAAPEISGSGKVDQDLAELVLGDRSSTGKIINARKRFTRNETST